MFLRILQNAVGYWLGQELRHWTRNQESRNNPSQFPPLPDPGLDDDIRELGTNVVPFYLYGDYGIIYAPEAIRISRICCIPLHTSGSIRYVLFDRGKINEHTVRNLSLLCGRHGCKISLVTAELE